MTLHSSPETGPTTSSSTMAAAPSGSSTAPEPTATTRSRMSRPCVSAMAMSPCRA
ncbi:hypothetical protein R2601_04483 [Salipiger bermudensis HTCC2601]|uniref:Uncharacterized protein n=1 Tax=Salipiger bermudensis (strain DSM 26914 / JCM 13377 / KCTC 12554 / HTCC2601) TaxID=314265 RepID=Q0FVU9_SALBH|nr:hypothetical protein R2601_04483 [Salipiger bermudensis HTCC2601]